MKYSLGLFKISLLLACCFVSGCGLMSKLPGSDKLFGETGVFRDRQADYLDAEIIPRTQIPDGLDSYMIGDLLVIPNVGDENNLGFLEAPRPRELGGNPGRGVVIQKLGEQSWIVVDVSASQVWPRIQDYWRRKGVSLSNENPTAGVMETNWFVLEGKEDTKEKFRVNIEAGFQDDSSEVKLLHMSQAQDTPSVLNLESWPETSSNAELENQFLLEVSQFLVEASGLYQAASVSFLAGNIPSDGKATIATNEEGDKLLRLESTYERSWGAIGRALVRAEIEIISQDKAVGIYDVNYKIIDSEDGKPGFFTRLVTLNGLFSGVREDQYHVFQIKFDQTGSVIDVLVNSQNLDEGSDDENTEAVEQAQELLLMLIRNNIA